MARTTRPKKKPIRRNTSNRTKKQKKGFPFLAVSIALLLSAFIGYFIFAVEKPAPVKAVTKPSPTVKKEETLPAKPEPKWQYEMALQTKEVIVDIPEKEKNTKPYQMQCASFRQQNDAESLKAKIAFQGLNSIIKRTESKKHGVWFRVVLGPYERKRLAEKDKHRLQRAKINGCQIWYWN